MSSEKYINTAHEEIAKVRKAINKTYATSKKIKNKISHNPEKHISEALGTIKIARMIIKKIHVVMKKAEKRIKNPKLKV